MKSLLTFAAFGTVSLAATLPLSAQLPVTPGGGPVPAFTATVTPDSTLAGTVNGSVSSSPASISYTESVVMDGSNVYGTDDLTFLLTVTNTGTTNITGVSLSDDFATVPNVSVGYIGGTGQDGSLVPLTIDEATDGTVNFNFPDMDAIVSGDGTQFLVVDTPFTSLPADTPNGGFGTVSISGVTPEPGSLTLFGTGVVTAAGALLRKRRSLLH